MFNIKHIFFLFLATGLTAVVYAAQPEARGICGISLGDDWAKVLPLVIENYPGEWGDFTLFTESIEAEGIPVRMHDVRLREPCNLIEKDKEVDLSIQTYAEEPYKVLMLSFRPAHLSCAEWREFFENVHGTPSFALRNAWEWENHLLKERILLQNLHEDGCWLTFTRVQPE